MHACPRPCCGCTPLTDVCCTIQIDARFNVPSLGVASSYAIKQPFKVMHPSFQAPPSGVKPMAPPPPPTP